VKSPHLKLSKIRETLEIQYKGMSPRPYKQLAERRIAKVHDEIRELRRVRSGLDSLSQVEMCNVARFVHSRVAV
jgi:hypothetical protein